MAIPPTDAISLFFAIFSGRLVDLWHITFITFNGLHLLTFTKILQKIYYFLTYPALLPLSGLGLPKECPKPLTVSRLRLPVRYPGFNGGRLHAILPPQFGPTMPPLSLWTA